MSQYVIFFAFAFILIIYFTYSLKRKVTCPNCSSVEVKPTGNKRYKESSNILYGASPKSTHEYEFECLKCTNTFWYRNRLVSTN